MKAIQYSTETVPDGQRFEFWKEVVCRHCIPAASRPLETTEFTGALCVSSFGGLELSSLSSSLHFWSRTPAHLRSGEAEDIWLGFFQNGYGRLEQADRRTLLSPEDLVLYDAAQAFRFSLAGENNHLLRIPRPLLEPHIPGIESMTAVVLDNRRPGLAPLREMMRQIGSAPAWLENESVSVRFSQTLLDLLSLALQPLEEAIGVAERDLYGRVLSYIERNLPDTTITADSLARAHHISTRTLSRAFGRHQRTPMAVLWEMRLQAAHKILTNDRTANITDVAIRCGYSDLSHFSHTFRKKFGYPPSKAIKSE